MLLIDKMTIKEKNLYEISNIEIIKIYTQLKTTLI